MRSPKASSLRQWQATCYICAPVPAALLYISNTSPGAGDMNCALWRFIEIAG
jgi:hypothetical protein